MHPFWSNLYDDAKDRRYGTLFFVVILVLLGLVAIACVLRANFDPEELREMCFGLGPGLSLVTAAFVWRCIRAARRNRREHLKYSSLSRDELAKARSKLKTRMKIEPPKKQTRAARLAAARRPDTDLKY
jgi:hypothetical protein